MKKYPVFILLLGLALVLSACDILNTPREFRSDAGKFSIVTTKGLKSSTTSLDTGVGTISMHMFTADQAKNSVAIGYADYPQDFISQNDANTILDNACSGAVSNISGTLISKDEISLDGNPGKEIVVNAAAGNGQVVTVKARLYLVKNRLYMVMILAAKGNLTRTDSDNFFATFKILP